MCTSRQDCSRIQKVVLPAATTLAQTPVPQQQVHSQVYRKDDVVMGSNRTHWNSSSSSSSTNTNFSSSSSLRRYQRLLQWRQQVQETAHRLWRSAEACHHWSYFGLDADTLAQEWYDFTLEWVLAHLDHGCRHQRLQKRYELYVKRFELALVALREKRNREFVATLDKYNDLLNPSTNISSMHSGHCPEASWTEDLARLATQEKDADTLLFHIVRQRPDVIVRYGRGS